MKPVFLFLLLGFLSFSACTEPNQKKDKGSVKVNTTDPNSIYVEKSADGFKLKVKGEDFFVNGINYNYIPIGENYSYFLWEESEDFIKTALDYEMSMLKSIGVNAVRLYTDAPPKWIQYIYEKHGIHTMLTHSFGRYGLMIDNAWNPSTDYGDVTVQEILLAQIKEIATDYKNTPGLLIYLLGNENNYGLSWEGAETENIPEENQIKAQKARELYELFNRGAQAIKAIDSNHPVAICNGDLQYLPIIAEECSDVDIFGVNIYRGISFTDAFEQFKATWDRPILFTEFGSDAYNSKTKKEDPFSQAFYLHGNWKEVFENAAGLGKANNCIGGFTFTFSDGWWKTGQEIELDIHNTEASWANGGYENDFIRGQNNMNEEWFGICAKGPRAENGQYPLFPRAAFYMLREIHKVNPYDETSSLKSIETAFSNISIEEAVSTANKENASAGE